MIYLYASSAHRFSKSYLFPHKMHRCRRVGSTCRSFIQEIAPKVWFWFAKILKRSGSFLGKVFHHYRHVFYRFDRNVIKPSGRAWFRCSVRGCTTNDASDLSLPSPGYVARRGAPGPPMATCPHCLRQILLAALAAHIAKSH